MEAESVVGRSEKEEEAELADPECKTFEKRFCFLCWGRSLSQRLMVTAFWEL